MIESLERSTTDWVPVDAVESGFPKLHCMVARGDTIRADLIVTIPAAIMASGRLYYFEVAATADSTAHAIAGALSESRVDAQWQIKGGPFSADWKAIEVPGRVTIRDIRLEVPHYRGRLHHVAALDTSGELILADTDAALWRKLREHMTCPTLEEWGVALLPHMLRSNILIPAVSYGMDGELRAYTLAPDAAQSFDKIVSEHVRRIGGLKQPQMRQHVKEAA